MPTTLKPGDAPRELPCRPILKTSLHLLAWSVASSRRRVAARHPGAPAGRASRTPAAGGLVARLAACHLIAHKEKRRPADVCWQHFADDRDLANLIELKGAVTPAQTTVATWAAELAAVVVARDRGGLRDQRACGQSGAKGSYSRRQQGRSGSAFWTNGIAGGRPRAAHLASVSRSPNDPENLGRFPSRRWLRCRAVAVQRPHHRDPRPHFRPVTLGDQQQRFHRDLPVGGVLRRTGTTW